MGTNLVSPKEDAACDLAFYSIYGIHSPANPVGYASHTFGPFMRII